MQKQEFLGIEAIAQGAIDSGISGIYGYTDSPSAEIFKYIQNKLKGTEKDIYQKYSVNEKAALECALGMSYAGKRALASMKQAGLNIAADGFMHSAVTGTNGGLVIHVNDDPSVFASQNEQDSRRYGKLAMIPVLEPSTPQEAYDITRYGFALSETVGSPVLLRTTTRLTRTAREVETCEGLTENHLHLPENKKQFVLLPEIARKRYQVLLEKQPDFIRASEQSPFNRYIDGEDKSLGIIACGIGYQYLMEKFNGNCKYPIVKISQYPLPRKMIKRLLRECRQILVLEDGYPMVEEILKGYPGSDNIMGRLDGSLPSDGELNPNLIAKALCMPDSEEYNTNECNKTSDNHNSCLEKIYKALNEVIASYGGGRIFADIDYNNQASFHAVSCCVNAGACITMAKGACDAGLLPSVAVTEESIFFNSGITGLLEANSSSSPITIIISTETDNAYDRLYAICQGTGTSPEHICMLKDKDENHDNLCDIIRKEVEYKGVSVIIL